MNGGVTIEIGAATDRGMRRQMNEDSLATPPADLPAEVLQRKGYLLIVADGIGGRKAGKTASELAVRVVSHQYYSDPSPDLGASLVNAVQVANAEVHRRAQEPAYERMGTTVVAAVLQQGNLFVASVGDSRVYRVGPVKIQQLTRDHSWVAEMVRSGDLTPEQARDHKQRHVLTRSIGRDPQVKVDLSHCALDPGDQVLLCSDGVWELMEDREIQAIMQSLPPQRAAEQMVQVANERGGPDNITALILRPNVVVEPVRGTSQRSARQVTAEQPVLEGARPVRKRLVVGAAIVAALLLASVLVATFVIPGLPSMSSPPSMQVGPVFYFAVAGDTPAALAAYFEVPSDVLPESLVPGQSVRIEVPGRYAILFSGQVANMEADSRGTKLQVDSGHDRFEVICDSAKNTLTPHGGAPQPGTIVSISGSPADNSQIEATLVEVWHENERTRWFQSASSEDIWLYSGFHERLIQARDSQLEGERILVRGRWDLSDGGWGFRWDEQDLYLMQEDGSYMPYLRQAEREPRTASGQPSSPLVVPTADQPDQPPPTATVAEPGPQSFTGVVGTQGVELQVRNGPSTDSAVSDSLAPGSKIQVLCRTTGSKVEGNDQWYRTPLPNGQVGYVSARWIRLQGAKPADVPQCSG